MTCFSELLTCFTDLPCGGPQLCGVLINLLECAPRLLTLHGFHILGGHAAQRLVLPVIDNRHVHVQDQLVPNTPQITQNQKSKNKPARNNNKHVYASTTE